GPLSREDGRLYRTWRGGEAKGTGYLDDYASVANGLYELHVASGELRWLEEAHRLARLAVELFGDDERGGFFLTPADGEPLVARGGRRGRGRVAPERGGAVRARRRRSAPCGQDARRR